MSWMRSRDKNFDLMFHTVGSIDPLFAALQGGLEKGGKYVTVIGDGDGRVVSLLLRTLWRTLKWPLWLGPSYTFFGVKTNAPDVVEDLKKVKELVESEKIEPSLVEKELELTEESFREMLQS